MTRQHPEYAYLDLLQDILENGEDRSDRTGTGTRSVFGRQIRFDLTQGFPLLTTKKLHTRSIFIELLWFLRGDTNIAWLKENKVRIWDEWADENGDLGPVYGQQWRAWRTTQGGTIDQIGKLVESLKTNPDSRRHVISAWNPEDADSVALNWCHAMFQCYSRTIPVGKRLALPQTPAELAALDPGSPETPIRLDAAGIPARYLDLQLYQRSADMFLGVPFNIASYALLTHMLAQVTNHVPGDFVHSFGDAHIYLNHLEQVNEQLTREPMPLPALWLNPEIANIDDFTFDDIKVENYQSHPHIAGKVSV